LDGRLRWVLIFWVFLMSAIAFLDRVNVSIAGQAIQKDFDVRRNWAMCSRVSSAMHCSKLRRTPG
jgi:hypothetical protein